MWDSLLCFHSMDLFWYLCFSVQNDVFLLTSNAMSYNSEDTVYYRQVYILLWCNAYAARIKMIQSILAHVLLYYLDGYLVALCLGICRMCLVSPSIFLVTPKNLEGCQILARQWHFGHILCIFAPIGTKTFAKSFPPIFFFPIGTYHNFCTIGAILWELLCKCVTWPSAVSFYTNRTSIYYFPQHISSKRTCWYRKYCAFANT